MVTSAAVNRPVMPAMGSATFLKTLVSLPEVRHPIERSRATKIIDQMFDRLLTGTLTSREVEQTIAHTTGRTLLQDAHGKAILNLLHGVALLMEANFDPAVKAFETAEHNRLTSTVAVALKIMAFEGKGDAPNADIWLEVLVKEAPKEAPEELIPRVYLGLGGVNAERGISAIVYADSALLESAAERFISLDKRANELDLPDSVPSAIGVYRAALRGDFESVRTLMNVPRELASKFDQGVRVYIERLEVTTGGKTGQCLDDFAETVRLLAIEDPFEGWNELARLIGADWPEDLSAEEAVRRIRE